MDDGLKQRLVGAVVLIAVAVLFVPVLFDRNERRQVDTTTQIPPQPDIQPKQFDDPKRVAGITPAPDPQTMFEPQLDAELKPEADAKPKLNAKVNAKANAKVKPTPRKPKPLNAQGLPNAWVVQLISTSSLNKAKQIVKDLMAKKYKAYYRRAEVGGNTLYRVYVGPNVDKKRSFALKKQLDALLKVDARVLRFQP